MAKKKSSASKTAVRASAKGQSKRLDPFSNKSLAVRMVVGKMPKAKASEVAQAVKDEYGHDVTDIAVYGIRNKLKQQSNGHVVEPQPTTASRSSANEPYASLEAIRTARQLLKVTGGLENATALLQAIQG